MPFASIDDINLHLPTDKLRVDSAEVNPLQLDAERIVRGYLTGYFLPTTLASWTDPETNVPGLIRAIVGRLTASFLYRKRYSEDSLEDPQFAQIKYQEAMDLLNGILDGTLTLEEVPTDEAPTEDRLTIDDFWPNDSTGEPKFTMEMNL